MPDGINLGLLLSPARWMRVGGAVGSNTSGLDLRGGLYLIPAGWGASFNFELGHCTMAQMNGVLNTFFTVSKWTKPYVQEIGYTYFNAHVGFDVPVGNFSVFVHGGYTYLAATVRGPDPVVVGWNNDAAKTPNMTVTVRQDGDVHAHTLSAKLGVLYMFGGL
jgi:hypothetical protein